MKVSYAATAVQEIQEALDFLNERSPNAAASLLRQLQQTERRLMSHPFSGKPLSSRNGPMRRVVIHPYLLFYRVETDDVIVIGLRHAARDPSSMPG